MEQYNKKDFRIGMVDGKVDYDETLKLSKMSPEQFVELFGVCGGVYDGHCRAHPNYGYSSGNVKCDDVSCVGNTCSMYTKNDISKTKLAEWLERAKADIAKDSKATEAVTPNYNVGDKVWFVEFGGKITEDTIEKVIIDADDVWYTTENILDNVTCNYLYSSKVDALNGILKINIKINEVDMEIKLSIKE